MKRTYAMKRLLEHGALSFGELVEITGWKASQVSTTLYSMQCQGLIHATGSTKKFIYSLESL